MNAPKYPGRFLGGWAVGAPGRLRAETGRLSPWLPQNPRNPPRPVSFWPAPASRGHRDGILRPRRWNERPHPGGGLPQGADSARTDGRISPRTVHELQSGVRCSTQDRRLPTRNVCCSTSDGSSSTQQAGGSPPHGSSLTRAGDGLPHGGSGLPHGAGGSPRGGSGSPHGAGCSTSGGGCLPHGADCPPRGSNCPLGE